MRVRLRLQRFGRKKTPCYRVVAISSQNKRDGKFLERLGIYHPLVAETSQYTLDEERCKFWLERGAIPSDTVKMLFFKNDNLKDYYLNQQTKTKRSKPKKIKSKRKKDESKSS